MHALYNQNLDGSPLEFKADASAVRNKIKNGDFPFLSVLDDGHADILLQANAIKSRFSHLIVFGTGGSSLGAQALVDLKRDGFGRLAGKTQVYFCDNVDPATLHSLLDGVNPAETCFLFVSKSGSTMETVSQFLVVVGFFKSKGLEKIISQNFLILTEPKKSQLQEFAEKLNIKTIEHNPGIGGRFSIFSSVALLPAAVAGVDIKAVLAGGKQVVQDFLVGGDAATNGALLAKTAADAGRNISILMSYEDRLKRFNRWYIQLWAESIGKNGKGTTPIDAIGTVDQHSQLQLFLDGPDDKFYTIIYCERQPDNLVIDRATANLLPDTSYLAGKNLGEILAIEAKATAEAIIKRGKPCRVLTIPTPDEKSIGALLAHYLLETVIAAELFSVDPFTQPAVEEGKIIARKLLGGK